MTAPANTAIVAFGDRLVGGDASCFIIAEIGNNHNGDFGRAIALVDAAVAAGADCAKFQMRTLDQVYRQATLNGSDDDLSVEYTLDLLRRFELAPDQHRRLLDYCHQRGILYLCTPWDAVSAASLADMGVRGFKVASADLTNLPLLKALIGHRLPLILSTGMSRLEEIQASVDFLNARAADYVLLHCQSTYPAAFHNINLPFMDRLKALHPLVGYSGHERGIAVSIAAVARGAKVLERHISLDRGMEGPDHAASLEPAEFAALVAGVREVEQAMGSGTEQRTVSQGELINRENLSKSLVAARPLRRGTPLTDDDIAVRSPGQGLSPLKLEQLVGRTLMRDMAADDYFFDSDLTDTRVEPRPYAFRRPWGIPVRYHDTDSLLGVCRPDIIEFHLSYQDMDRNPRDYLAKDTYDIGFVVHAPELFGSSHLMDLATPDEEYRRISLRETQRVIDITRGLKALFPKTERPLIVANVGGFTMDAPLPEDEKKRRYEIFARSLDELDRGGVELIPQTMAPFPWHFGGQRHQNLFIHAEESAEFCRRHGLRMCLDVSHSMLAANHFGFDFNRFLETLAPVTAHLHLGDARGVDGEGLQVGDGDMDYASMARTLDAGAPGASFIPEIWQGHKNGGEGFWIALERLEQWF